MKKATKLASVDLASTDTAKVTPCSSDAPQKIYLDKLLKNRQPATDCTAETDGPSQETLHLSLLFLMSKFALTQEKSYAEAAYQHLHMLAVRCDTDTKPRFLYRSLAMDWVQVCRGQPTTEDRPRTGPH